jgi:hypothetical protein
MKKLIYPLLLLLAAFFPACSESDTYSEAPGSKTPFANYSNEVIIQWNTTAQETMQGPSYNPLLASRILAMVHIAIHDVLNNIAPVYETYILQREDKKADPVTAVSAAAHAVLVASFPDKKEQLDIALTEALKKVKPGTSKDRGLALGADAANAILALRNNDGAFADPIGQVNNPEQPGLYQPVPPTPILYAPFWTTMQTFALTSPAQFRVPAMPSLSSQEYADAFNEVKHKGAKENSTRTPEETAIAKFWYEFSEIGWNRVTVTAVRDISLDLLATARLFALVNMGLADSYTAGWDSKFHYNFWRPYTAIRAAAADNNKQTVEDISWEPLMNTPPVHDYPSTHSVLGNAAATILSGILGKNTGFTMTSTSAEPVSSTRNFNSFSQAAIENGDSRVFAGIHFRFSCERGLELGKAVGDWILDHQLKLKPAAKSL